MPTVEDYFDDDTDLPLPSSSKPRNLHGSGVKGALLEEITSEDEIDDEMDYGKLAEQNRGIYGADATAPPPQASSSKGKLVMRDEGGEVRPSAGVAGGPGVNPNTPMGGFMGDMMKLQQAEDARMEKLRKQFGNATLQRDPSVYKGWNSVYPIYFDAKVSINGGRRVPRKEALWWPQAEYIARACRTLGLPSLLEPDKCHPADWENPGRVKVQIFAQSRPINPIIKNRTQLYHHLAQQLAHAHPNILYTAAISKPNAKTSTTTSKPVTKAKAKSTKSKSGSINRRAVPPIRLPTRPPRPPPFSGDLEDRYPLHSPLYPTGVAVSSIKRDLEQEKEAKKKGLTHGGGGGGGGEGEKEKEKMPKMKRVVVRGKR